MGFIKNTVSVLVIIISQLTFAGGISGGGGNTSVQNPVGADWVANSLSSIRVDLVMHLKAMVLPLNYPDLYSDDNTIIEIAKKYPFSIQMTKPCYDPAGNAADASVNITDNKVCISAHRLGQKLTVSNIRPQLIALLGHEYSHFLGYNEDQANGLQEHILLYAENMEEHGGSKIAQVFYRNADSIIGSLNKAQQALKNNLPEKANYLISTTQGVELFPYRTYTSALDHKESVVVMDLYLRLRNLTIYSCSKFELDPVLKNECAQKYIQLFNGANFLEAVNFKEKIYDDYTVIPTVKIYNLEKNPVLFEQEIIQIIAGLTSMYEIIKNQSELRD